MDSVNQVLILDVTVCFSRNAYALEKRHKSTSYPPPLAMDEIAGQTEISNFGRATIQGEEKILNSKLEECRSENL